MKIFLSTSFSNQILPDGSVRPEYRASIEKIINHLEAKGHSVYCAVREENWVINQGDTGQAALEDAEGVRNSDVMVAIAPNNPLSAGVQFELGLAYGLNKKIILTWQANDLPVAWINKGLAATPNCHASAYQTLADLPAIVDKLL